MDDIFGKATVSWGGYTVYDVRSDIVLGMCALWHMLFSMSGLIYQLGSPCGSHGVLSSGLLWITTLVTGGASGVQL